MPAEPPKAWHAFTVYRDMGVSRRSLRLVAEQLARDDELAETPNNSGLTLPPVMTTVDLDAPPDKAAEQGRTRHLKQASGDIRRWSARWNWVVRAAAWDKFCDGQVQKQVVGQIREARVRMRQICKAVSIVYSIIPSTLLRRLNTPEGKAWLEGIPMDDLLGLTIEMGPRLRRLQEAERIALGVAVKPDEDATGSFIWELELAQPPAHVTDEIDAPEEEKSDDPYDVDPSPDPAA